MSKNQYSLQFAVGMLIEFEILRRNVIEGNLKKQPQLFEEERKS